MAIVLRIGTDNNLKRIQTGESIQADSFERLDSAGNLVVGSTLIATEELQLGSVTAGSLVRVMNTLNMNESPIVNERRNVISPTTISAQQDDYDPTDFGPAGIVRISLSGNQTITGFAAPAAGEVERKYLVNIGGVDTLTITHEDASSAATNRVVGPQGADIVLLPSEAIVLTYDSESGRWRAMGQSHATAPQTISFDFIEVTNTLDTNINAAATDNLALMDTQKNISGAALSHDAANDRVDVNTTGAYHAYIVLSYDSAPTRYNGRVKFRVNGTVVATVRGKQGYVRNTTGHGESSLSAATVLNLTAGDYVEVLVDRESNPGGTVFLSPSESSFILTAQFFQVPGLVGSDHGNLDGLGDDDHPQYLLTSGNRTMTGDQLMGGFSHQGERLTNISPGAISSEEDNYDPAGFGSAHVTRLTLTGDQNITGFAAPSATDNERYVIENIDAADSLTLLHQDTGSTAANRIICPLNEDLVLGPSESAEILYDNTTSRWRVVGVAKAQKKFSYRTYSMLQQANSTLGFFAKANDTGGTSVEPTTSNGDPGINNGGIDPDSLGQPGTLVRAWITFAQAAVSVGTQDATKDLNIDMYHAEYGGRSLLTTLAFQVTTTVGIFNNLGASSFTEGLELAGLSQALAVGELFGFQFTNTTGTGAINALGRAFLTCEFEID